MRRRVSVSRMLVAPIFTSGLGLLTGTLGQGQEPPPIPSFEARADAITVDAVVLDEKGRPVRGLTPADFAVLEDGRPQPIVGFKVWELSPPAAPREGVAVRWERMAANERSAEESGRGFAILIDDLGISPVGGGEVVKAVSRWLEQKADPRDEVTVMTSSGAVWWTDEVGRGREDLLAVVQRVRGKGESGLKSSHPMNDWEASRIPDENVREPADPCDPTVVFGADRTYTDRVVDRWAKNRVCPCCTLDGPARRKCLDECAMQVRMRAQEVWSAAVRRQRAVLKGLERLSRALAGRQGRKAILAFSETFVEDTGPLADAFRATIDASRRANTAIYFVDARGLPGPSGFSAENAGAPGPGDLGRVSVEDVYLTTAGGDRLADDTGGFSLRNTNDLAAGLDRAADESSSYYLLGYQPERSPDGGWHKLEVKVARPGVKVRARRGYFATRAEEPGAGAARRTKDKEKAKELATNPSRALDPALLAGGERRGIPLRMASYVRAPVAEGGLGVLVALDFDSRHLKLATAGGRKTGALDLTILAVSRDRAYALPIDQRVDLDLEATDGWWSLFREVSLPPGVGQVRALLRDVASGATGSVSQRLEIPAPDRPYLGTPIVTDRTLPALVPGEPPRLIQSAHRRLRSGRAIYCQYEVFSYAGPGVPATGRLTGSHMLLGPGGATVSDAPPTPIAGGEGGRLVRQIVLPGEKLAPGDYELVVTVEDRLAQITLAAREAFTLEPEAAP